MLRRDATQPLPAGLRRHVDARVRPGAGDRAGRALGRLPERLVVVGIEGRSFEAGAAPAPAVAAAVEPAVAQMLALLRGDY